MHLQTGLRKVAVALYEHLNTPISLSCWILVQYGRGEDWDQLAAKQADPRNYLEGPSGAEKFRRDAQACNLLRKSPLLPIRRNLLAAAEETFELCEEQCFQTNQLLQLLDYPGVDEPVHFQALRGILHKARKIASRIVGPLPDDYQGRFGPGTSFELKGSAYSTLADKVWAKPTCTSACMPVFEHDYWRTLWGRQRLMLGLPLPRTERGNRFSTVKKDATKHRGICIEPLGNLWVQLGIGGHLKRRLAAVGLHIGKSKTPDCPIQRLKTRQPFDGQHFHRQMARDGSLGMGWATIDLSNASDTVAFELVKRVLPPDLFSLLCACRSPYTLFKGAWRKLEKFSSMGNGATFEMETLVFTAILAAGLGLRPGHDLFVYGDDILLPEHLGREALAILQAVGMTPNVKKSFVSGPFRESCGGDYFSGFDVRSVYADKEFESPLEWVALHNNLKRKWPGAILAHKRCAEQIPSKLRVFGPEWLGDQVLHGLPRRSWVSNGIRWLATIVPIPTRLPLDRWCEDLTLTLALLGSSSEGITPRDGVDGYRLSRASVS